MSINAQKHRRTVMMTGTKIEAVSPAKARRRKANSKLSEAVHKLCEYNKEHCTNYSYGEAVVRGII